MKDTTNIALNKIVGTSVRYREEDLYIERFKEISTGKICIFTHIRVLHINEDEVEDFLSSLTEPVSKNFRDKAIVASNTKALNGFTPSAENVEMKATLMEMLSKVKANPTAIPQAREACNIVNTMVNLQKTEIEMIKMVQGKKLI